MLRPWITIVLILVPGVHAWADRPKFVVHEWGVMVTGRTQANASELGPPADILSALPSFVLRHEGHYKPRRVDHGWDKPVLHLYGPDGLFVKLSVGTPLGRPIAYWPPPTLFAEKMGKAISDRQQMMVYSVSEAVGMEWSGTLRSKPARTPAPIAPGHWWSALRDVPSSWLDTPGGSERFIFYEGTARQEPAIRCTIDEKTLLIENHGDTASGPILVIVNDGVSRRTATVANIGAGQKSSIAPSDLDSVGEAPTLASAKSQWTAMGMSDQEAAAIVTAWRGDLIGTVGVMVCGRMPDSVYGKMFPLAVVPRPDELVRVGMVFDVLPGQDGRLAWLPGLRPAMTKIAADLSAPDFRQRDAATRQFARMGDLARPFLKELESGDNAEASRAAAVLLKQMESPTTQPVTPDKASNAAREPLLEAVPRQR